MTGGTTEKLRALLKTFADRAGKAGAGAGAEARPDLKPAGDEGERRRRACGERLQKIVGPLLRDFAGELRDAGHEASLDDHADTADAYPSVALSFTPRSASRTGLASVLTFRYDPRRGIAVSRDMKPSLGKGRVVTSSIDRIGTMKVEAVTAEWVETKTLSFVEAVLKVN